MWTRFYDLTIVFIQIHFSIKLSRITIINENNEMREGKK